MRKLWVLVLLINVTSLGCAITSVTPERTQLQIREFQTRSYEMRDAKMVMKALLNVLQDDGFIVKNANVDLGLITGAKEIDVENNSEAAWQRFWLGDDKGRWKKSSLIECSSNVSEFGNQTRVRVNFQVKLLNNHGEVMEVKPIDDPNFYQEFFSKVDKGIFIQKEKL